MNVVYFPYTTIDFDKAARMARIWGPLNLLQPSPEVCLPDTQKLQEAGLVQTLLPVVNAARPLGDVLNDFKQWAVQHAGGDLAVMMEQGQAIPFFNSQSSTQIVAEIRQGGRLPTEETVDDAGQKVLLAQLLLAMAQEWDGHQQELVKDIKTLDTKEKEMMALLRGEKGIDPGSSAVSQALTQETTDRMIPLRLKAWARVMATAGESLSVLAGPDAELLFLTDNRNVLAQVLETFSEAQYRLQAYRMMAGQALPEKTEAMPDWLAASLTVDPYSGQEEKVVAYPLLDLVEIPRMPVGAFPLYLSDRRYREATERPLSADAASCWVGCIALPEDVD